VKDYSLPKRPCLSQCRVNMHETKYFPDLFSRWKERNHQHGANVIKVEPREPKTNPLSNINIVTQGSNGCMNLTPFTSKVMVSNLISITTQFSNAKSIPNKVGEGYFSPIISITLKYEYVFTPSYQI